MATTSSPIYDVAVVGGGIVGLATARALLQGHPNLSLVLLEKEAKVAQHQTGHNSGVVHSGIYYKPGSLKARLCTEGVQQMQAFCERWNIPYQRCGKVIVATKESELSGLEALLQRGRENGIPGLELIGATRLKALEPYATGLAAIHSPNTAIVSYPRVAERLAALLRQLGGQIIAGGQVERINQERGVLELHTQRTAVRTRFLVNCAGLHSDRVARMAGATPQVKIVPFRGEYYHLKKDRQFLVQGLIYPVPDPQLPFLGVHFTRTVDGEVEAGPNAVLAFSREGYRLLNIRPQDLLETLSFPGFWHLAGKYWRTGLYEYYRSLNKQEFVKALQKLIPNLRGEDVVRANAGVRAQAVTRGGGIVDDFVMERTENALHVLNSPSPAATASLAIGQYIADFAKL